MTEDIDTSRKSVIDRRLHNQVRPGDPLYEQALNKAYAALTGDTYDRNPHLGARRGPIEATGAIIGGVVSYCEKNKLISSLIVITIIGLTIVFADMLNPVPYVNIGYAFTAVGVAGIALSLML
jgi:hypothetical protein